MNLWSLTVRTNTSGSSLPQDANHTAIGHDYLCGETNFGDSIEDEWVVTFILRELSFNFPILWVKLQDTDGEFLLIEAAKALPRWLNPDVAENRVKPDKTLEEDRAG